jgi:DNA polymerase-3 subunit epsilon
MKKFFYDLETTGLDYRENAIHQISGCIEINGTVKEYFNIKIRPFEGAVITQEALKTCNLTEEQIMAYQAPEDGFKEFMRLLSKYVNRYTKTDKFFLVGYNNNSFDNNFLKAFYDRYAGDPYFFSWFWSSSIDVMVLASEYLSEKRHLMENFKLMTVSKEVGLTIVEEKLHDAEYDINLTRDVYRIITNKFGQTNQNSGALVDMPF